MISNSNLSSDDITPNSYHSLISKTSNTTETIPSSSPTPSAQFQAIPHDSNTAIAVLQIANNT
jgi:hypothetical protein